MKRYFIFPVIVMWIESFTLTLPAESTMPARAETPTVLVDSLSFGGAAAEQQHGLKADNSEPFHGALDQPARKLLPRDGGQWEGGTMDFTLKVDPLKPNYITVRLWGSDVNANRLILFCEGKQIGYRHLGDVDILDFGTDNNSPAYNGRFFYNTFPLPVSMTNGKTVLHFEIRSTGRIWGCASTFENLQKPMEGPTRGIYRLYTHTDGFFVPPVDEVQGAVPADIPKRSEPGIEVLGKVKEHVNHALDELLKSPVPLDQMQLQFLARAWHVKWTQAYHNEKAIEQIIRGVDSIYAASLKSDALLTDDKSTWNPGWFGFGPAADAVRLLSQLLEPSLDKKLEDGKSRREAWSGMFQSSRDWLSHHRRLYTNQSMIVDLNLYRSNRAVAAIDPKNAMPEEKARHYLYEAIGLVPWLGSDTDSSPAMPEGGHYFQLTEKGLTRELGYVGYYGEVIDWVTQIYDATRDPGKPGDEKIKAQAVKIAHDRGIFRYPMLDADGNRAMRIETVVGWRDTHYPGDVCYAERTTWDASPLYVAAATLDPEEIGYVQQMFEDNQYFKSVGERMTGHSLRVTMGLLDTPDEYEILNSQPPSPRRLPMSWDQPDFVFADGQDGVVALKHGSDILYASLYWRATGGINNLARIHYITPSYDRIAVVREETKFSPSGQTYKRPDWINFAFGNGGPRYPGNLHSAYAGEELPIAKPPPGVEIKPGENNVYAGKGEFYTLRYGPYLIGMNTTMDRSYELDVPQEFRSALELVSGKRISTSETLKVGPVSTVVLYLGYKPESAPGNE